MKTLSIVWIMFFAWQGAGAQVNIDSLYNQCQSEQDYLCKDSTHRETEFSTALISADQDFFQFVANSFDHNLKRKTIKKYYKRSKFVSKVEKERTGDSYILNVFFYTTYTWGSVQYEYKGDSLFRKGCSIKTNYRVRCGDRSKFHTISTVDIWFFKTYVAPFFGKFPIKEACWALVVGDTWTFK